MNQHHDIYVRVHTRELEKNEVAPNPRQQNDPKWPEHALILDCETRITADQSFMFGFEQFCQLRDEKHVALEEGIFHSEQLSFMEMKYLRHYTSATSADTVSDGCDRLRLYPQSKFVTDVLGGAIQARALIVGFNLGFDLSRLALDWENADNGGWSLILSQWWNRQMGELMPNKFSPRIVVKALNSKTAMMHSTRAPLSERGTSGDKVKLWPAARFLDVRTLLWALTNKAYSVRTACKDLGLPGKLDHKPSGRVDLDEIEYCRQDVRATVGLLNAAKKEYDLHSEIDFPPDKLFSPASVAKAYLEKMNIAYPSQIHER